MGATWCTHVSISLSESYDPAVANSREEEQIGAVWSGVIAGADPIVRRLLAHSGYQRVALGVPIDELLGVVVELSPDLHERAEAIGCNGARRRKVSEDRATPEERLKVGSELLWEERDDFVGESLLVAYPLQQLTLDRRHLSVLIEREGALDVSSPFFAAERGTMRASSNFQGLDKGFWAHIRSLSQTLGYTDRSTGNVKVPTLAQILRAMKELDLLSDHLVQNSQPTEYAELLLAYFEYRARLLNDTVQHYLMDAAAAKAMYDRLSALQMYKLPPVMNKQKGEKKQVAYLTAMVNMLIEANAEGIEFDHDPRQLTTVTEDGKPLRTLARRVDGAFPSAVNPVAVWEIKEYYYTTTFGSRVADGVYETLLDGMELEEMREETGVEVEHLLVVDAHYTWWTCGRAYLCRIVDMLHMGYVDEVLFGKEIEDRLPVIVYEWVRTTEERKRAAKLILPDKTALL